MVPGAAVSQPFSGLKQYPQISRWRGSQPIPVMDGEARTLHRRPPGGPVRDECLILALPFAQPHVVCSLKLQVRRSTAEEGKVTCGTCLHLVIPLPVFSLSFATVALSDNRIHPPVPRPPLGNALPCPPQGDFGLS
jgi:hypothetical protein